ncbi:MAG: PQQ-like beta-propeller repeat protein [Bryobacteraceae bacterium]|nr:PQQ-like beta-propeller repeat protein [Bryobacteraceae bacterium]
MNRRTFLPLLSAPLLPLDGAEHTPDWPQWRGPLRNGISTDSGLMKSWPSNGPPVVWSVTGLGDGYGSVSMKGDRLYVQGTQGSESVLFCLSRNEGKRLWSTALGRKLAQDRGGGPRATPTIDGDRVYALTENGDLACVNAANGGIIWRRNLPRDFGGSNPNWHYSESPLIDGDRLIITPGGPNATIAALEKATGKTIWTSKELSDPAGYSSCIPADVHGVRVYMTLTHNSAVGVRAEDGKLLWRYQPVANRVANVATPIFRDNRVFYTTAYGTGCALLELRPRGREVEARELYFSREMQNHHGGVVLIGDHLYGFSNAILTCLEFATGKVAWRDRSVGKGSLVAADGHLYLLGESNTVGLAEATPQGYREKGRFRIEDQGLPSWAHPVVCGGRLYIRNRGMLSCYNVRQT